MNSAILLLFMLGFGTGIFIIILCILHYRKNRNNISLYLLFIYLSVTFCLIHSAVFSNIRLDTVLLNYLHDISSRIFYGLMTFSVILFVCILTKIKIYVWFFLFSLSWSFSNLFFYLIVSILINFKDNSDNFLIIISSIVLYFQLIISSIISIFYILYHKEVIESRSVQKGITIIIILFLFLLPFFIIQALTPNHSFIKVPEILKQVSVPSLMAFYICINIIIIVFYLNYLHQLTEKFKEIPAYNLKKYSISDREKEVIQLLYKGYSTRKIGENLYIAFGTVKTHIHKIYQKTDSHNKIELFSKLYKHE